MPISEVQRKTGSFVGNSGSVTTTALDAATTAGNAVLIMVGSSGAFTTPTGFTKPGPVSGAAVCYKQTSGGETTFTFPSTGSLIYSYTVVEVEGLDPDFPVDAVQVVQGNTNTNSGGTMAASSTYDGLAVAVWAANVSGSTTVPTFSGHTNGFVEQDDHGTDNGTNATGMSFAWLPVQAIATYQSTATASAGTVTSQVVVFTAAGARREPNIPYFWGFSDELAGYPACHSVSPANNRYWEAQTGSPTIDADGLRLLATAAACQIGGPAVTVLGVGQPKAALERLRLRFNTSLPAADLVLATITSGADTATLWYRTASQKFGLQLNSGAEQLSDAAVTAGGFLDIDVRVLGATTAWTSDWRVNYGAGWVDQTQATVTAGAVLGNWTPTLGWSAASTADVSIAYAVYSVTPGHWPLGDYTVVFLGPDPAGTPTATNTANFRRFTANGSIDGAFSATAIRDALDDWPPTFGASADGLAVITASTTDYCEVPMATYDAAGNGGSVRAVRVIAPIWAASATAATFQLRGYDGSASTTLFTEADPGAGTGVGPPWIARMWRPTGGWTQAQLDAATVRSMSNDATPDIGPHALGLEVAVQDAEAGPMFGETGAGQAAVEAYRDPLSGGALSLNITAPADADVSVTYEVGGTPTTVDVAAGDSTTEVIDAPDDPAVNYIKMETQG